MAETSSIEWTDATWNPITGRTLVSEGCRALLCGDLAATRLRNHLLRGPRPPERRRRGEFTGEVRFNEQWLEDPIRRRRPRRIFVCAHGTCSTRRCPMPDRPGFLCDGQRQASHFPDPDEAAGAAGNICSRTGPTRRGLMPAAALANVRIGTSVEDQAWRPTIASPICSPHRRRCGSSPEPLLRAMDLSVYLWGRPSRAWSVRRMPTAVAASFRGAQCRMSQRSTG